MQNTGNPERNRLVQPAPRAILIAATLIGSWLGMMAVHEFGHMLHAWASGGRVAKVVLHPLAISRTDVSPNPHPNFVAWGGAIWGVLLPLAAMITVGRIWPRIRFLWAFFAGFCLVANGAYLAVGYVYPVGDAADLLKTGTRAWMLAIFGLFCIPAGFWLWHGLGPKFGIGKDAQAVDGRTAFTVAAVVGVILMLELFLPMLAAG